MYIKSFAKINLGIEVLRKRPDGFHEIRTLFQSINFFDTLEFLNTKKNSIDIEGNDPDIPWNENNLIYKAAQIIREYGNKREGVRIRVQKRIPPGKGLGGGSSNAAVTLIVLNDMWKLSIPKRKLQEIGESLGADVPYFLEGGLCLGQGKGEKIIPAEDFEKLYFILVMPDVFISTPEIYSRCVLTLPPKESRIIAFLSSRKFELLENNLEETVLHFYPQLKSIKNQLIKHDSLLTQVSGTGSSIYGLYLNKKKAEHVMKKLAGNYSLFLADSLSREEYWRNMMNGV